ncbi:MAG: ParB/RepB/Spo0J family partition protein [Acidimicrobiales bacterium]
MTAAPRKESVCLSDLVLDDAIYARPETGTSSAHIANLAEAIRSGTTLDPIIVDGQNRIIDGWHRWHAYKTLHGLDHQVQVERRSYASDTDALLDAVATNVHLRRSLDPVDQRRVTLRLLAGGVDADVIATTLHVSPTRVIALSQQVAYVSAPELPQATVTEGTTVVLKGSVSHLKGQTITADQAAAIRSAPGLDYRVHARQLSDGLRWGLVDLSNEATLGVLVGLRDQLSNI